MVTAHEKQEVFQLQDLSWGFDNLGPYYPLSYDGSYWRHERVDPAPCYAHNPEFVKRELEHLRQIAPVPVPLGVFSLSHETLGRTSAHCSEDLVYEGDQNHVIGIIVLSGKRIPLHPAMTRYLVAHEYGHFVENWLRVTLLGEKATSSKLRDDYQKLVRPEASNGYGPGKWHQAIGEIFANDFRVLIAERELEFWPHDVSRPEDTPAAVEWWGEIRKAFWSV